MKDCDLCENTGRVCAITAIDSRVDFCDCPHGWTAREREKIVAWLRRGGLSAGRVSPDDPYVEAVAIVAADCIEAGEHDEPATAPQAVTEKP